AGGDYRPLLNNFFQPNIPSIGFVPVSMSERCAGSGCPGLAYNDVQGYTPADFLMGAVDGGVTGGGYASGDPALALKNTYAAPFLQSDWKATRTLTLNLGVRWDYQGPLTERYNRLSEFDGSSLNVTGTPGVYVFNGRNGVSRDQTQKDFRNFGPRI